MRVTIKLFGVFRIDRFKEEARDYSSGTKVQEIIKELNLPDHILGIVIVNGEHSGVDYVLNDGDALSLLPILGGG